MNGVVEKIVAGGHALVRTEAGVVFARGVLPGERVRLSGVERRRGTAFAARAEVLAPSPARVSPACPYAGACGGCDFQHASYEAELRIKKEMVEDALRRIARLDAEVAETVPSPTLDARQAARLQGGAGRVGYFAKASRDLVPIESCPALAPPLREALADFLAHPVNARAVVLRTDGVRTLLRATARGRVEERRFGAWGDEDRFVYETAGRTFRVSPDSFFQVNPPVAEALVAFARGALRNPAPDARLWDLYAGVGLFGLSLGAQYERAFLLEIAKAAVHDARANAQGMRVEVRRWDAARGLPEDVAPDDDAVLDPSRAGLDARLVADLNARGPRRLLLIECDLASFARDVGRLAGEGGSYDLAGPVHPFDMFPRTAHVETAALLIRRPTETSPPPSPPSRPLRGAGRSRRRSPRRRERRPVRLERAPCG